MKTKDKFSPGFAESKKLEKDFMAAVMDPLLTCDNRVAADNFRKIFGENVVCEGKPSVVGERMYGRSTEPKTDLLFTNGSQKIKVSYKAKPSFIASASNQSELVGLFTAAYELHSDYFKNDDKLWRKILLFVNCLLRLAVEK